MLVHTSQQWKEYIEDLTQDLLNHTGSLEKLIKLFTNMQLLAHMIMYKKTVPLFLFLKIYKSRNLLP
jgi:hypothetical protein